MTRREGKDLLQECMNTCECTEALDDLILYKTGNRKRATDYQDELIDTPIETRELRENTRYVVKCFTHMEIFAAWGVDVGRGRGKYICYRNNLAEMENEQQQYFREFLVEGNNPMYFFKGRAGVMEFVRRFLA